MNLDYSTPKHSNTTFKCDNSNLNQHFRQVEWFLHYSIFDLFNIPMFPGGVGLCGTGAAGAPPFAAQKYNCHSESQ